jgi:hypothetical protein
LKVYFISQKDEKLNREVMKIAKIWEKYVSLRFDLATDRKDADIRIDYDYE